MADNTFEVKIITPEREFYSGRCTMVEFNTIEGEVGIYKNHIPLTVVLAPGIATMTEENGAKTAAIHAGFAEVLGDKVNILAEIAEWPEEINVKRAKDAEERARRRIEAKGSDIDMIRAELALKKALVRQEAAQ